ncbi:MAG: SMC-Scp complex subunit ScpB [Oscillatoriales cyanobacterium RM2_1_1]|nr:SMC-Scp complex subunit ScpB [Oscillatoriales cyanobacterium SM2_3_0]NJO45792.1 SMC-Scp complex subunit ScpB [Oscillatoriales cyanobacterium RM2_1_1]
MSILAKVEAVLYLKGQSLSIREMVELTGGDRADVEDALIQLMSDYAHRETALEIVEQGKKYSLQLKSAYSSLIGTLIPADLGLGVLRTLAAIALSKGITQTQLVDLRGSGAYQQVQELVEQGFVTKRKHPETRSYWLQVTEKFHQYFQVDQLPQGLSLEAIVQATPDQPDE